MSQEKVERYKKEKANRKKIVAQERAKRTASVICGWAVVAIIVCWAGYSGYQYYDAKRPANTYYCDTAEIDNYLQSLEEN